MVKVDKIAEIYSSTVPGSKDAAVDWLASDLLLDFPGPTSKLRGATIVMDFAMTVSAKVEVTLDGTNYTPLKENQSMQGFQNRFIRIPSNFSGGVKFNIRTVAAEATTVIRYLMIGEV